MTQKEIVTALRCCASNKCGGCLFCNDDSSCISKMTDEAADLIENQQREIEALRQANEGLRYNLTEAQRRGEGTPPYDADTTDGSEDDEICRAALEAFGKSSQMQVAIEEMSELTKELCKNGRGQENTTHIAEEIADVEIMLQQMVILYGCAESVETFRRYKLERLAERIKEAKQ